MDETGKNHYVESPNEHAEAIELLAELMKAGGWIIRYADDGTISSVKWGDGFRQLMGYEDESDFPNEMAPFLNGILPEDKEVCVGSEVVFESNLPIYEHGRYRYLI